MKPIEMVMATLHGRLWQHFDRHGAVHTHELLDVLDRMRYQPLIAEIDRRDWMRACKRLMVAFTPPAEDMTIDGEKWTHTEYLQFCGDVLGIRTRTKRIVPGPVECEFFADWSDPAFARMALALGPGACAMTWAQAATTAIMARGEGPPNREGAPNLLKPGQRKLLAYLKMTAAEKAEADSAGGAQ